MAVLVAVIRGFARRGAAALGNFWQDLTRTLLYILLPLSVVGALVLVSQGVIQTPQRLRRPSRRSRASSRRSRSARPPRRSRSSSSAPTAAASSTSTRAMPVREPDRALELRRDAVHPADPGGADLHVRAHGRQPPPGLGALRGDAGAARRRRSRSPTPPSSTARPRSRPRLEMAAADGTTGGNLEGKEQRFGIADIGALGGDHDRRLERLGQLRATTSLHRHRRRRAAGQHDDRRGRSSAASARASTGCCCSSCSRCSSPG